MRRTSPWRRRLLGGAAGALAAAAAGVVLAVPWLADRPATGTPGTEAAAAVTVPVPDPERDPGVTRHRLAPPATGIYLGVSNPDLPLADGAVADWTRANGPRPAIVNWFQQWLNGERRFRPDWARRVARAGAVPMITWEPWYSPPGQRRSADQPDVALARIAAGDHDPYIRAWARDVAAYGQPVMIRLMHEMNGDWYPWGIRANGNTAADYVRAWRRVHRIFDAAGADNVSWIWSVNNLERPDEEHEVARAYPGDRWVDWVSTSGFNWGQAFSWSGWRVADDLYGDTYRELARFGKPIMISEIGTTGLGGDPREWVVQTFRALRADYPRLRAVLWYDDIDGSGLDFRLRGPLDDVLALPGVLGRDWVRRPVLTPLPPG